MESATSEESQQNNRPATSATSAPLNGRNDGAAATQSEDDASEQLVQEVARIADEALPEIIITSKPSHWPDWAEMWRFRELLYFFTWRSIKVRYKQTLLGMGWVVLQPFITMIVFSFVFGTLAPVPSYDIPYPIFSFAGLVPWSLFAGSLTLAAQSVVANSALIRKVYFPHIMLPISDVLSRLVDFGVSLSLLLIMMLIFGFLPRLEALIMIPVLTLFASFTALGLGLWLGALNVRYRDVNQLVPFFIQLGLYLTPVIYPSTLVENETLRALLGLNPMASVVEGFRWVLLGIPAPPAGMFVLSGVVITVLVISGLTFFERAHNTFADVI